MIRKQHVLIALIAWWRAVVFLSATTVLGVVLVSCGGGGGGGGPASPAAGGGGGGSDPVAAAEARSLAPVDAAALTKAEMRHFLVRTSFGSPPVELAELRRLGLDRYLDRMLRFRPDSAVQRKAFEEIGDETRPKDYELVNWWLHLMVRTDNPFREVLTLFWHDHFATSQRVLGNDGKRLFFEHVQMLRSNGLGNLRDLFYAVIEDPAVLVWLDGVENTKDAPNQNLAREFWELFSLGEGNYTEADIRESARALTGWRLVHDRNARRDFVVFDETRFDADDKTILGQTGPFAARDVVDVTLDVGPAAEWVCRSLFEHFCYADAPQSVVDSLAKTLRENRYELEPVVRRILRSEAFFSSRSREGRIKSPIEYVVGFLRTTGLELEFYRLGEILAGLGQQPTQPPHVGGWPDEGDWLSAHGMLERGNAINAVLAARDHQFRLGVGIESLLPPPSRRTAEATLDALAGHLRVTLATEERELLLEYLNSSAETIDGELVVTSSPFDGTDPQHVDERVRGVLFCLSQHPAYALR